MSKTSTVERANLVITCAHPTVILGSRDETRPTLQLKGSATVDNQLRVTLALKRIWLACERITDIGTNELHNFRLDSSLFGVLSSCSSRGVSHRDLTDSFDLLALKPSNNTSFPDCRLVAFEDWLVVNCADGNLNTNLGRRGKGHS